jgi:hypothetical protein
LSCSSASAAIHSGGSRSWRPKPDRRRRPRQLAIFVAAAAEVARERGPSDDLSKAMTTDDPEQPPEATDVADGNAEDGLRWIVVGRHAVAE